MACIYATKFVLKVKEEDVRRVESVLVNSVLPELSGRGYAEPLVVSRKRTMDKLDRERAERSLSELSRKMVEVSQARDPGLEGALASLLFGLVNGVTGYAHGMVFHSRKNKHPREYELMRRELYRWRNREVVRGVQLDVYASHSGGDAALPSVLRKLGEEFGGLLFLKPRAIEYTVFGKSRYGGGYALQTFVAVPSGKRGDDPRDVKARMRTLVGNLTGRSGCGGVLALRSTREGASEGSRCSPNGIGQHRGDEPRFEGDTTRGFPDVYELVTLWRTEDERDATGEWLSEKLSEVVGGVEKGYGGFAMCPGEVWGVGVDFRTDNGVT